MASPLEQFVNSVRSLTAHGNFRELCDVLNKSTELLVKNRQHLDNVLETLDLEYHSLIILAILSVKLSLQLPPPPSSPAQTQSADQIEILFSQVQEFIMGCNAQHIRYDPESFAELCHMITRLLIEFKAPIRGLDMLAVAIKKLQTTESQLTLVHADLCQLSLLARSFKRALEFLDVDISTISPQEDGAFGAKYFLLYYYYGGMIYTAMKQYERALYMYETVVSTPARAVSHIMLEAYKKYVLVSLILYGKVTLMPKYTSQVVTRFIKPLSQAYDELAFIYSKNNTRVLSALVTKYQDTFFRDHNMGLAKQVVSSLYKKNIQRLTKTFLTLSLTDVASRVELSGPAEAEKYILNMIEDGEIFASINQKDGMVIFLDDPENYNSPDMLSKIEEEMSHCIELDRLIQKLEEEILVNANYIEKACKTQDEDLATTHNLK